MGGQTATSGDGQAPPTSATQPPTSLSNHKNLRRANTFTGAPNEEEQRNIISLRYRAD
ncbi:P-type ATPase (P-ATPase) Superfamily, partial [Phytophthora palmivora]